MNTSLQTELCLFSVIVTLKGERKMTLFLDLARSKLEFEFRHGSAGARDACRF